jgi:CBS domain-containing protein
MTTSYRVRDFMTSPAVSLPQTARLLDAALLLRGSAIRHLPIVDGKQLTGIITDRDIQRCAPSRLIPISEDRYNSIFEDTPLSAVMTRNVRSISPETLLSEAASILQSARFGCLPVVENGELVGILTRADLLSALARLLTGEFPPPQIDTPH